MKNKSIWVIAVLLLLFSCDKDDSFPLVEEVKSGKKWNLEIGSSPFKVYQQLQDLGLEKNFSSVGITYRKPYASPQAIKADITLYDAISVETTQGRLEGAFIQFDQNKVTSIEKGGSISAPIQKWPENQPEDVSINIDDALNNMMQKLVAIFRLPIYQDYQIVLPDKILEKAFDPDMGNFDEWHFSFFQNVSDYKDGRNSVRLYFKNKKLVRIRNEYEEFELYN